MTVMTQERQAGPAGQAVKRPGIGIVIDPALVRWYRERKRSLSRQDLADRITALGLTDDAGRPLRLTKDAIAKIENPDPVRGRNPKPRSLRALCAGLGCSPEDLMPRAAPPGAGGSGHRRVAGHLRGMADFARKNGIRYTKPSGGRSYNRPLRDAYMLAVSGASDEEVAAAVARARELFPAEPALAVPGSSAEDSGSDLIDALGLPQGTRNTLSLLASLASAGLQTRDDLEGCTDEDLRERGLPGKVIADIRARQTRAARTAQQLAS